jgi:opine dehydrogenase
MRVAILGAGAIGFATAALLCEQGHKPVLWSPSGHRTQALAAGAPLVSSGAVQGAFHPAVAGSAPAAQVGAPGAVLAVPGYAHRAVIEAVAPHLRAEQTVLFSSHMSFAALLLRRLAAQPPIVAWGTTVVTGRRTGDAAVWITNIRSRVDAAVLPHDATQRGLDLCRTLFGDRFTPRDGLLAIALSNLNPQNHLAIALCNLTRMEKAETWKQYANTTPAVGRLMEALDAERLSLARACGVQVRTLHEHFRLSFDAQGATMGDMARDLATRGADPAGPTTLDSRYVTEDMPFGIWPTLCLGREYGVAMPLHMAGLQLLSALYGRDLALDNDILPALGPLGELLRAVQP